MFKLDSTAKVERSSLTWFIYSPRAW